MDVTPQSYDPLVDASDFETIEQAFSQSIVGLSHSVDQTLSHDKFIERLVSAKK